MAEIIAGAAVSYAGINGQGSWENADTDVRLTNGKINRQGLLCAGCAENTVPFGQGTQRFRRGTYSGWRVDAPGVSVNRRRYCRFDPGPGAHRFHRG